MGKIDALGQVGVGLGGLRDEGAARRVYLGEGFERVLGNGLTEQDFVRGLGQRGLQDIDLGRVQLRLGGAEGVGYLPCE
ncbi:MAG: hypothetical protein RBU25_14080 [Lentisphaeria bacterium]|jgi:hypothetical protein|nr:hypothetical protein [Lentisphaeria bacterium]